LFETIHDTLNKLEVKTYDAFPSGHTELTLLVLYYAQRFHRRTFWWILPAGSALIISTVYLRYHYVVDVIAGAFLALAIILIAKPLYRRLGGSLPAGYAVD
jgi:membrane-associated phospholipid phosphatase